jgi:DNA polymerase-3 subunit beta
MVSVTVRKAKFKLCSLEGDEYPVIPEPTHETPCVTVDAALFGQTLKTAWVACADQEETRAALQSVLISIGEGALTVVSTDGRRLCKVEREVDQTATPVLLLVPKKSADTIVKMFPKGSVHLYWDALMLHVRDSIQTFSARLLEGKFPAYRNLIPKTHEHSVDVDRDILMAAIKRVIVVTDKPDKDKSPQKLIRAELAGGELTLSTRGAQKGLATDSVPIDWNGSLVTAYNGRFLSEGLGTFKSPRVTMGFNGPISAMILTGKDDPGVMYLLMPVRVDPEQDASWAAGVPA